MSSISVSTQEGPDTGADNKTPRHDDAVASRWAWRRSATLLIAWRYFRSTRKDASIRFLSTMTAGGIALGVAALVLAVAALAGFQAELLSQILSRTPALQVLISDPATAEEVRSVLDEIEGIEVQEVLVGRGLLAERGNLQLVEIVGYESSVPRWFPDLAIAGEQGVILSLSLARRWGVDDGEVLEVISPRPQLSPLGLIPRNRFLVLRGTFSGGRLAEHEGRIAIPLSVARGLLWPSDRRLDIDPRGRDAEELASQIRERIPGVVVETARDLNRPLFLALLLEKTLMFIAVFLIVAVASQTLVSSLSLVIANKTREIGMLATLGMAPAAIRRSFVVLGGLLATVGIGIGGGLGCLLAWFLDAYEIIALSERVYVVDYVPFRLRFDSDLPLILIATLVLTLTASYTAGKKASRLEPVAALRR